MAWAIEAMLDDWHVKVNWQGAQQVRGEEVEGTVVYLIRCKVWSGK